MNEVSNQAGYAMGEPAAKIQIKTGDRFVRIAEVMSMVGLKTTAIYRMQSESKFPRSVPLPGGRSAWILSEVQSWMEARIAMRDETTN